MKRRQFLSLAAGSAGWVLLCGHSPYRQWIVYRQTHLIILTSRDDLGADELGEKFAAIVRGALPDSQAAVGRGPRVQRIASLISTQQVAVGVVSRPNALAMYHGEGPFQQYGASRCACWCRTMGIDWCAATTSCRNMVFSSPRR